MSTLIRFLRVSSTVAALIVLAACASAQTPAPTVVPAVAPTQANAKDLHIHITQVDTSRFPQVTVYVSVTDANGQPASVEANNIVISEESQVVQANQIKGAGKVEALTTLLVIDISGSMNQNGKLDAAKQAALAYVNQMRPGDKVGVLTFNTQITYVQPLTDDKNALTNAINSLKAVNDTAMYDALVKANEILSNLPGRKAVLVLTDGIDNQSKSTADNVIAKIGPTGLSISTVGLGDSSQGRASQAGLDEPALKSLAERAGGAYAFAYIADALKQLYEQVGLALQSEYAITYTSPAKLRDGVNRSLSVTLAQAGARRTTIQGEYNPGGLVPEVIPSATWPLFLGGLAILLLLFFAPALISRGAQLVNLRGAPSKKASRIKLKDQTVPRVRMP